MPEELSEFVRGLTTEITRRANRYVDVLEESDSKGGPGTDEKKLLSQFEQYIDLVLDSYVLPGSRRRDSLVFAHLYRTVTQATPKDPAAMNSAPKNDERRRGLLTALLAAEVEARGPLRLTRAQNIRLAEIYGELGAEILSHKLPLHAALAYERAAGLYLQVEDYLARDRSLLAQARARHRSPRPLLVKAVERFSELTCGYGYQPYRLIGCIALQLVFFSLTLTLISNGSTPDTLYLALAGFIGPPGLDEIEKLSGLTRVIFVMESYLGVLTLSVFFALLVRRWFRV